MNKYKNTECIYCDECEQYVEISEVYETIQPTGENPTDKFLNAHHCSNYDCKYSKFLLMADCPVIQEYLKNEI